MKKGFYRKFAVDSIRKNRQIYLPYLFTCILMTTLFFIVFSLAKNGGISDLFGQVIISSMLTICSRVMGIFAFIFLFYANSFLIKQRKREFGIYNILGLEKRHISRILLHETLILGGASTIIGLIAGLLLNKLAYAGILRILGMKVSLGFEFNPFVIMTTVILFVIIHLVLFLSNCRQVHFSNTIELLRAGNVGEKEPKTKWILTIIGLVVLILGYGISVKITNPLAAFTLFFVAVLLVIAGTYLLFTTGSIAWLKMLKKRKGYYYKANHFINVSGLLYRMKQNAVSLASICILSTIVIITMASTISLYTGCNDVIHQQYPRQVNLSMETSPVKTLDESTSLFQKAAGQLQQTIQKHGETPTDSLHCTSLILTSLRSGNHFELNNKKVYPSSSPQEINNMCMISVLTLDDYNRLTNSKKELENNEVLLFCSEKLNLNSDTLKLDTMSFSVKEVVPVSKLVYSVTVNPNYTTWYIVVKDEDTLFSIYERDKELNKVNYGTISYYFGADIENTDAVPAIQEDFQNQVSAQGISGVMPETDGFFNNYSVKNQADASRNMYYLYGGIFFIGIFLTIVFLAATILIIYYKQISEGLQDARRFEIMQKVGLSLEEIRKSIHSQILMVFFLPLVTAGIHAAFAFPMVSRLLKVVGMVNTKGFIICLIGTFAVFSVIYILVYFLTARAYYKIVSK